MTTLMTIEAGGAAAMTHACLAAAEVLQGGGDRLAAASAALRVLEVRSMSIAVSQSLRL